MNFRVSSLLNTSICLKQIILYRAVERDNVNFDIEPLDFGAHEIKNVSIFFTLF